MVTSGSLLNGGFYFLVFHMKELMIFMNISKFLANYLPYCKDEIVLVLFHNLALFNQDKPKPNFDQ